MKISPYTIYLELQPNALLVRQKKNYLQKVGVTLEAVFLLLQVIIPVMTLRPHILGLEVGAVQ
jgi:hypothetical protein